jgi:glutaredoxin
MAVIRYDRRMPRLNSPHFDLLIGSVALIAGALSACSNDERAKAEVVPPITGATAKASSRGITIEEGGAPSQAYTSVKRPEAKGPDTTAPSPRTRGVTNLIGLPDASWSPWPLVGGARVPATLPIPTALPVPVPVLLPVPVLVTTPTGAPAPSPTVAPTVAPPVTGAPGPTSAPARRTSPLVFLYGSSHCGPCRQAKAHIEARSIAYTYRDLDTDPTASDEAKAKLARKGERFSGIPLIDIDDDLMVGWNARTFDDKYDSRSRELASQR